MDNKEPMAPIVETKAPSKLWMVIKKIVSVIFWLAILGLAAVWITDFIMVRSDEKPVFCIDEVTHEFDDGTVYECTGLGYKIYDYNRTSITAYEFGPFFIEMRDQP